ncbi:YrhB domain-containing protein [Montanilutibacter psychrotolerans]|nr:YrhB domain-containing protein [Lysobacter psychrotolerans]
MSRISEATAFELAQQRIDALASALVDAFSIIPEKTVRGSQGWLYFYNTTDFIRSSNPSDSLVGNGPILVFADGGVEEFPSSLSLELAYAKIGYDEHAAG